MISGRLDQISFRAMGTVCTVAATVARPESAGVGRALAAGRREVEACERVLSRFSPLSDLSRLNGAHGAWTAVDRRLIDALRTALRLRDETRGLFDPTILPALAAVGYDRSYEQLDGRSRTVSPDWRSNGAVEVDVHSLRARVETGAAVDLGGIGKGIAAARALQAMHEAWLELPGALVDLGGDVAVWGMTPNGGPWRIAVADPRTPGSTVATIAIVEGAVATSGRDQRRFGPGRSLHHLIDPATGTSGDDGPVAATVVGPYAEDVEAFATALAILPMDDAAAYLGARPDLSALLIPPDGDHVVVGDLPLLTNASSREVFA